MQMATDGLALFYKGGPLMVPLLLCSVFIVAIAMERFSYFHRAYTSLAVLLPGLRAQLQARCVPEAIQICRTCGGMVATVVATGLERGRLNKPAQLQSVLDGAAALGVAKLRERMNYLSTMVTLSPLLGLLGTIIGMIKSFSVLSLQAGQPLAITGGVGESLIATAFGLCVAVLALLVHSVLSQKLDKMITDLEQVVNEVMTFAEDGSDHEIA